MPDPAFSPTFDLALRIASVVHAPQRRKGTEIPYVTHVVHVARLLALDDQPEPVVVAGLLHDVLEDFDATHEETRARLRSVCPSLTSVPDDEESWVRAVDVLIGTEFGQETRRLVGAVTEQKSEGGERRPWIDRKREQLAHLERADASVAALKAADALHNVESILGDLASVGPTTLERFNASREDTLWYYRSVARLTATHLNRTPSRLGVELTRAVDRLAKALQ